MASGLIVASSAAESMTSMRSRSSTSSIVSARPVPTSIVELFARDSAIRHDLLGANTHGLDIDAGILSLSLPSSKDRGFRPTTAEIRTPMPNRGQERGSQRKVRVPIASPATPQALIISTSLHSKAKGGP